MLGKLAGRGSTLPLERLYALKPDLIVDAGNVDQATYRRQKTSAQLRLPYYLFSTRLAETPSCCAKQGCALMKPNVASGWLGRHRRCSTTLKPIRFLGECI